MKQNQNNISVPTVGIDRDTHPMRLKDGTYTFAKNISIEDTSGNGVPMVQSEPSNILCKEFAEGGNIIGFKYEASIRKTFLFISNQITGVSEVGYLSHDNFSDSSEGEIENCNCEPSIELGAKLEDLINYTESCSYVRLISDDCIEANGCLNFSINHPINTLNIVFKNEQCGKRLYWTDGYNPPRFIHLEELEEGNEGDVWKTNNYYHKGTLVCKQEFDLVQTCLNCDALKIFPDFSIPYLEVKSIVSGGNLYEGTYEFFIAFCDISGNQISDYYSHSFPIPIFNQEELIVDSLDLSRVTNLGIKLDIDYLDTNFSYYKIACVFVSALGSQTRNVLVGVFPTSQTSITVSTISSTSNTDITINRILTKKPVYNVVDKLTEANGHLFLGGLTSKPTINLQPIVNLMGPMLPWKTIIAKEDFYKFPINSQKFKGYMRDEGYALSISFGISDGTETNDFTLINRAPYSKQDYMSLGINDRNSDMEILVDNSTENPVPTTGDLNVRSILEGSQACLDSERIYRHQYYNTAVNLGYTNDAADTDIDFNDLTGLTVRNSTTNCKSIDLDNLNILPTLLLKVPGDLQFFDGNLVSFLNTKLTDYKNPSYTYYSSLFNQYLDVNRYLGLGCYQNLGEFTQNCTNFNLLNEIVALFTAEEVSQIPTYLEFINYEFKEVDFFESQFSAGIRGIDTNISNSLGLKNYPQIQLRIDSKKGYTCGEAITTPILKDVIFSNISGYIFKNFGSTNSDAGASVVWANYTADTIPDTIDYPMFPVWSTSDKLIRRSLVEGEFTYYFYTSKELWRMLRVYQSFSPSIAKNAIWFKLDNLEENPYIQINFSTLNEIVVSDNIDNLQFRIARDTDVTLNRIGKVRLSIFDGCSLTTENKTAVKTLFLNLTDEPLIDVKSIITTLGLDSTKDYILSVDSPIQRVVKKEVSFNRILEDLAVENIDMPVGDELKFMEIFTGDDGKEYYRARNVNHAKQAAQNCVVFNSKYHAAAWAENGDTLMGQTCTIPPTNETTVVGEIWTGTSLEKSFLLTRRGKEVEFYDFELADLVFEKEQTYSQTCYYKDISNEVCAYENYEHGIFGYQESLNIYPDNDNLFNSSKLKIKITEALVDESIEEVLGAGNNDLDIFNNISFKQLFKLNFGTQTSFVTDSKLDFTCKPIRHFKFPDNIISPFVNTMPNLEYAEAYIHPIGIEINNDVVNIMLNLAVKTGQITQEQRDSIIYFKIKRSYRGINRTVLSKGFLSDMIKYTNKSSENNNFYSNFPFNSLNNKELIKQNKSEIAHPFNKLGNNRFSFISPEIMNNTSIPSTEIKVDGYLSGNGFKQVDEVRDHEKMVVLNQSAISLAEDLGRAEALFELGMGLANLLVTGSASMWAVAGTSTGGNYGQFVAWGGIAIGTAFQVTEFIRKTWEYKFKWIEAFKNAGKGANFAHFISGVGNFNNFTKFDGNSNFLLRDIKKQKLIVDGNYKLNQGGNTLTSINHIDREKSLYLFLGEDYRTEGLVYTPEFIGIDNSNKEPKEENLRTDENFNVANIYAALKIYNPAQYGNIENTQWNITPGLFYLKDKGNSSVFGGDVFISRFTYKKKYNYYLASALNHVDFKPIKYSRLDMIGTNKYFIDYDTEARGIGNYGLPYTDSTYNLQFTKETGKYITEGRFYHYEYGFHNQLVESEINCWTRVGLKQPKDNFYPNFSDFMELSQETVVSIRERESFLFNSVFSNSGLSYLGNFLKNNYDPEFNNCTNNSPNGLIYSQPDVSEKTSSDPWLIFKPNDFNNFKASYGKFIALKSIESQQLLGLFENKLILLNRIDEIRERITPETAELGTGSIFRSRPIEFHSSDSGYGGTQHGQIVSNEFGHFYTDARRGQVFRVEPNGEGIEEITSGLTNWFKEHLPFKIIKGNIEGLTDLDLDNNYKGLGLSLGWDARFKRLFLTKLDYIVNNEFKGKLEYREIPDSTTLIKTKVIVDKTTGLEVDFADKSIFTPAHFTVAYSPITKTWISYYSFYPNFYIPYNNYFRTGVNEINNKGNALIKKTGLWSHLITNKSFGVFYGSQYNWGVELVSKEQFNQKILTNLNFSLDSIRYQNEYDFSQNTDLLLDSAIIYNNTNNSGKLNFIKREENNRFQYTKYPKYNNDGSSDILVSYDEGSWRFNDFFNRTINENNNVPLWNYDNNAIDKIINPQGISFKRTWTDRLRGDYFQIRYEGGSDTRYKQIFKWNVNNEDIVI